VPRYNKGHEEKNFMPFVALIFDTRQIGVFKPPF